MRGFLYLSSALCVVALAYWAYFQGYQTRQTAKEVVQLQKELTRARQERAILKAEWAYLNRPERLRVLAEMNFERLKLMPLAPEQFGSVSQIAYPSKPIDLPRAEITSVQDTSGDIRTNVSHRRALPHTPEPELFP